ncbi:interferon-induced protein with tetratricopeptide repeats 5-like [Glandiceps talaboti]
MFMPKSSTTPHVETLPQDKKKLFEDIKRAYPSPFFWDLDRNPTLLSKVEKKALEWLTDDTRDKYDDTALHNLAGFTAFVQQNSTKAKEEFQQSLTIRRDNLIALTSMVYICIVTGDKEGSKQWMDILKSLPGHQCEKRESQALYEKGFMFSRFGAKFYQRAEEFLRQSVEHEPNIPTRLKSLVVIMNRRLKRRTMPGYVVKDNNAPVYFVQLSQYFLQLIKLEPNEGEHYILLGEMLEYASHYKTCKDVLENFCQEHPDKTKEGCREKAYSLSPENMYVCEKMAHTYQTGNQEASAMKMYTYIVERFPGKSSFAHHHLATYAWASYERTKNKEHLEEAISQYKTSIQIDKTNTNAMGFLGIALCESGPERYEEAKAVFEQAIDIRDDPNDTKDVTMTRIRYSICLLEMGEIQHGYTQMAKALENHRKIGLSVFNEFDRHFNKEIKIRPDDPMPLIHKAQTRMYLKKPGDAKSIYTEALLLDDSNVNTCLGLGKAYAMLKDHGNAKIWLEKAALLGSEEASCMLGNRV